MTDTPSITADFQGIYIMLGIMASFNLIVVYCVRRRSAAHKTSVPSGISTSIGSLLLAAGAFGIFLTLFRYFTVLELHTEFKPGQWELLLPLIASIFVFLTSAAAYWVIRSEERRVKNEE